MDYLTDARLWLNLVQWLVTIALGVSVWLRKPGEDAARAVAELAKHVEQERSVIAARMATFEERLRHMPTSDELSELEGTVKAIDSRISSLAESMTTVRLQLGRIEDWLLQHGGSR